MPTNEGRIEVAVPVRAAYDQWTQTFIEERGEATGARRGEVPPDRPLHSENEAKSA